MIERIIHTLRKDGAAMFPGADSRSMRFVSSMLSSHRFAPVPPQYANLLKQTDGLVWNGVEFFGTRAVERDEHHYVLPGLIETNLDFLGYEVLKNRLVIGRAAEELFVYDNNERNYQVVDRLDFSPSAAFPTFPEIVFAFMDELF